MSDRYTSKRDLARLFLDQDGRCKKCPAKLSLHFRIDHIIALARGGLDVYENKQLLCIQCHDHKTFGNHATSYGSDIHDIRKIDRLRKPKANGKTRWPKRKFRR